jgi:cell division protein FtsQ
MRHVSLAARRARQFFRRPPPPRWYRPALYAVGAGLGLLLGGGFGIWAISSGRLAEAESSLVGRALALTADAGLAVRQVYVDGRLRTGLPELRARLGVKVGDPILGIDTEAARERLEQLRWVDQASVVRMLPDHLYIHLIEREPLALWQRDHEFAVIDRSGAVIESGLDDARLPEAYRHLRVLVGADAPSHAAALFALLSTEPALSDRVVAATWVGDRRWDLHLDNGIDVMLPEHHPQAAWHLLAAKAHDEALLQRAIKVVDLRLLPARIRLELDPSVLADHHA